MGRRTKSVPLRKSDVLWQRRFKSLHALTRKEEDEEEDEDEDEFNVVMMAQQQPSPEIVDGEEHFKIEKFVKHRWYGTRGWLKFWCRFEGSGPSEDLELFAHDLIEDMTTEDDEGVLPRGYVMLLWNYAEASGTPYEDLLVLERRHTYNLRKRTARKRV